MVKKRVGTNLVDDETGEILATEVTVAMPLWKTPYNHDTNKESDRVALHCPEPSLTKQEFVDETDINTILDRFMKTKEPPPMALPEHFVDISGRTTYYEMATKVAEANQRFYTLDAETRAKFQNDPTRWADAVVTATEHGNREDLRKLGFEVPDAPDTDSGAPGTGNPPAGTPAAASPSGASAEAPKPA